MKIIKSDEKWYRAEQKTENKLLTYVTKAYGSTALEAIKKLLKKEFNTIQHGK